MLEKLAGKKALFQATSSVGPRLRLRPRRFLPGRGLWSRKCGHDGVMTLHENRVVAHKLSNMGITPGKFFCRATTSSTTSALLCRVVAYEAENVVMTES